MAPTDRHHKRTRRGEGDQGANAVLRGRPSSCPAPPLSGSSLGPPWASCPGSPRWQVRAFFHVVDFPRHNYWSVVAILPHLCRWPDERAVVHAPAFLLPHDPFSRRVANERLRLYGPSVVDEHARLLDGNPVYAPQHAEVPYGERKAGQIARQPTERSSGHIWC
eukprot:CAMPEP_0205918924 /NCGR_PEP_ID=MMETSP1325-20131115/10103_1 /ASSEMBLY_ACC=CAM_ASM_000708 /TAXON_ID=236786 /ORGANISM="Florenciella sp., Strain RCC1007" /LENGTH=163 /DNA_ID=CAMNT_0053286493 /DNA_START=46 /DNA_END=534 /DNA_ORIENTATION=-